MHGHKPYSLTGELEDVDSGVSAVVVGDKVLVEDGEVCGRVGDGQTLQGWRSGCTTVIPLN